MVLKMANWFKQTSHWIGEPSESFTFVLFVPNVDSFSRQEIFLFYLCWRKINVALFNLVYFVIWTGPLWKWFPGTHILWSTIPSTPTFFTFDPKGRNETQDSPLPPPASLKGAETVAVYPGLLRISDLRFFNHSLKSADLKPHQNQYTILSHFWSHL